MKPRTWWVEAFWSWAIVVFLLTLATVSHAEVWKCPTTPPTYQDVPCEAGRPVEVRGTVISLNVRHEPLWDGPRTFVIGRRSDDLPSTSSMIDAYRWDTRVRPTIVEVNPWVPNWDARNRLRDRHGR